MELLINGKELVHCSYLLHLYVYIFSEKLNTLKGNNNHNFLPNIERLREQNIWYQDLYLNCYENYRISNNSRWYN